jgi:hypothetical protein
MSYPLVTQCGKSLNFTPHRVWPEALPAIAWKGELVCGFERRTGVAFDVFENGRAGILETLKACYPELGLSEIARLTHRLERVLPADDYVEIRENFFRAYGLKWNDRLGELLTLLRLAPVEFQDWVDERGVSPRDLSPVLALGERVSEFHSFLRAMTELRFSRSEGVRCLELGVELFLMGRPLNDLLPSSPDPVKYLRKLEEWRRPNASASDRELQDEVERWPWPSQVQGQWQRFGDQSGLEVKIRSTSPEDFNKKLERLLSIGNTWSTKS